MLNIGFITNNHFPRIGGLEYCTHFLAEHLNGIGDVNTSVACGTLRDVPATFKYNYPCYRAKSFSVLTPWLFKKNRERMIKTESVNILHGQMLHGGGLDAMALSKKFNIPFVAQSHGSDVQVIPEINYGALMDPEKKEQIKRVIKNADKLIAVSSINKQCIIELGAQPENVEVIHNGVDIHGINTVPFQDLRLQLGLKPEDFVIITVGRNKPVKRLELLFAALQRLKDFNSIKCICVGPKQNLEKLAKQYNVENQVVFTGTIPENLSYDINPPYPKLVNAYRASNVYVSTSYVESFGNAASEALACGIPIVVGQKHGVRDIIKEGETGWTMPQETASSLAELIIHLYEKREFIDKNSERIKASVSHLTWQNVARQTVNVYKSVL